MFRPSDMQLILLTTAAQRSDGSLLPAPDSIGGQTARVHRSIPPLIKNGLVSEALVTMPSTAWREEDGTSYGAFITDVGREMIGAEPLGSAADLPAVPALASQSTAFDTPPTKISVVLDLLRRSEGATLDELVSATGWLPHTMRASLTGLRKKGHAIAKSKRGDVTCYTIAQGAA